LDIPCWLWDVVLRGKWGLVMAQARSGFSIAISAMQIVAASPTTRMTLKFVRIRISISFTLRCVVRSCNLQCQAFHVKRSGT
jgi:hypothetical protein